MSDITFKTKVNIGDVVKICRKVAVRGPNGEVPGTKRSTYFITVIEDIHYVEETKSVVYYAAGVGSGYSADEIVAKIAEAPL